MRKAVMSAAEKKNRGKHRGSMPAYFGLSVSDLQGRWGVKSPYTEASADTARRQGRIASSR